MSTPLVSVIVVNYNGLHHLDVCLHSLASQTYVNYEIIFVDNGSTDGSIEYITRHFPHVSLLKQGKNLGFCGGNNVGIKYARGEFIALINNDTEADSEWLEECVCALQQDSEIGFVASRIRLFDQRTHLDTTGDLFFSTGYPGKRGWLQRDGSEFDEPCLMFGACAGAAVYRRSMLDHIGLFDLDFENMMEDIDLSFRAQLAGYQCLYVPTALVYHKVGSTARLDSPNRQYWSHRNHWYVLIKNVPFALWIRYSVQILVAELFVFASAVRKGRLSTFVKARIDVVRHLTTMLEKRREILQMRAVSNKYLDSIIRKDWLQYRLDAKRGLQ